MGKGPRDLGRARELPGDKPATVSRKKSLTGQCGFRPASSKREIPTTAGSNSSETTKKSYVLEWQVGDFGATTVPPTSWGQLVAISTSGEIFQSPASSHGPRKVFKAAATSLRVRRFSWLMPTASRK